MKYEHEWAETNDAHAAPAGTPVTEAHPKSESSGRDGAVLAL
jgi:hypothetical protein